MGSQMSKTETLFNIIGHRMDDDPVPMLYVGPTQKNVESMSKDRVIKMIQSTPSLFSKLEKGKRNTVAEKFFAGVRLGFAWAGSATELASHPAALVQIDELDRMEADSGGEGDPVEITEARTFTFPDGRQVIASTPTLGTVDTYVHPITGMEHWKVDRDDDEADNPVQSPIWRLWQEGTRFEWSWPCPDCHEYFIPRLRHLRWPKGCTPAVARREAKLVCPHCGVMIDEVSKRDMNARGRYVAPGQLVTPEGEVIGEIEENSNWSFWVSGLCSPWQSFGQRAASIVAAYASASQERIQAIINTGFGELFSVAGKAPAIQLVMRLRGDYRKATVPSRVQMLTAGLDVQKSGIYYAVRGWGHGYESFGIEHGFFMGDPAHAGVWEEVTKLLERDFDGYPIVRAAIDSGYKPGSSERDDHMVYLFARANRGRVYATKGHDKQNRPYFSSQIDISYRGKIIPKGLQLWHLDSDYMKTWLYNRFELEDGHPGTFHIHRDAEQDYFEQLVSESRIVKPSGQVAWVRIRRQNHYLDCEALNVFLAHVLNVHNLERLPDRVAKADEAPSQTNDIPAESWLSLNRNWLRG